MQTVKLSIRYSPYPVTHYPVPAASKFLAMDEQAWNLAWLSFDFDNFVAHKDARFSSHVLATVRTVIGSMVEDVTNDDQDKTLRSFLLHPAPKAVKLILGVKHFEQLPMYRAYGQEWADTILSRSKLYREAYDAELDTQIGSTNDAVSVLRKYMNG